MGTDRNFYAKGVELQSPVSRGARWVGIGEKNEPQRGSTKGAPGAPPSLSQHLLPIPLAFFDRPVLEVCPELLGHFLVTRLEGRIVRAEVLEIEAYDGQEDLACHASRGRTPRNATMFGPAGCWYVYLCYGIHWLLNIVTGPVGYPAAILIRGVGSHSGPGILTRELKIDKRFNALPSSRSTGLWLERNPDRPESPVYETTPRIGVDYAGEWADKPYRFIKQPG